MTMLMEAHLHYSIEKVTALDDSAKEELRSVVPKLWDPESGELVSSWSVSNIIIDELQVEILTKHGIEVTIKQFRSNRLVDTLPGDGYSNNTTHVHIPNIGLLCVDEVTYLEDVCTDQLQSMLDEGWRILAVCPPRMQRRPDYILGRTKEVN